MKTISNTAATATSATVEHGGEQPTAAGPKTRPEPNDLFRQARERLRTPSGTIPTRREIADMVNVYLADHHPTEPFIDRTYTRKIEAGVIRWPHPNRRAAFRHVLGARTDAEIGFRPGAAGKHGIADELLQPLATHDDRPRALMFVGTDSAPGDSQSGRDGASSWCAIEPQDDLFSRDVSRPSFNEGQEQGGLFTTDWPAWFGMRIAHVLSVVHNWQGAQSDVLQNLLHQEILMFEATASDIREPAFTVSRRQALITLATLPIALATSGGFAAANAAAESFLANSGASLTACWHLLKGSDLETVDRLLAAYILELETLARKPSKYQQVAARLTSQAHRICGIIALHRNNIRAREHHCLQALGFASLASDTDSRVSALISLASTYFYESDPMRAASTYEEALVHDESMSPLQRSRIRAELAVVYGQLGRERDSIGSTELAEQLYPVRPEDDPSYLFAEFTRGSLVLEQGLSYAALAQRYPTRGYQQAAADTFARVEHAALSSVPDRIRFEIVNHQAATAVMLGDLDAFETYLSRGVQGTLALGSRQRHKEVTSAWRRAEEIWPNEQRLKTLGRELLPALNG